MSRGALGEGIHAITGRNLSKRKELVEDLREYRDQLLAENRRLEALNAELVAALEPFTKETWYDKGHGKPSPNPAMNQVREKGARERQAARAALAKAKGVRR